MSSRDCKAWADEGLPLSTTNNEAVKLFDDVITQYITWTEFHQHGGVEGTVKKMLETDPEFVMGRVVATGLDLMGIGRTTRLDSQFLQELKDLELLMATKSLTAREKLHCKAVLQLGRDQMAEACETWEDILIEFPNDALALKFAHDSYFYLGNSVMIRDSVGRVLPYWKPSHPFYGYLKGMYAFGLEETNLYPLAETYAREALALNPTDCWATHAAAHCYEMTGRANEGIQFMSTTENNWSKGAMLACHNYWHWSLYHIENGEYEEALALFDQQVGKRVTSGSMLDIVDGASLLKRMEFEGLNVGERWSCLYDLVLPHIHDHITVFNDIHFLLCFLGARENKMDVVNTFMNSINQYTQDSIGTNHTICKRVGLPVFNAVIAYTEGRFDDVVELMYPLKNEMAAVGGSNAQRDVLNQLLIHGCLSAQKANNFKLGKSLVHERKLLKENSPMTDRMLSKWLSRHQVVS